MALASLPPLLRRSPPVFASSCAWFAPDDAPRRREAIVWSTAWLLLALAVAAGIALPGG